MSLFPIFLDLSRLRCVVVGGGVVGSRKVKSLIEHNVAHVRVVSPDVHPTMPHGIEHIAMVYDASHLAGANLVFATTNNPQINRQVAADARAIGALCNIADAENSGSSDFVTTPTIKRGPISIAINSSGSPGLSKLLCNTIDQSLDPAWAGFAQVVQDMRHELKTRAGLNEAGRREIMRLLVTPLNFDLYKQSGTLALQEQLGRDLNKLRPT